MKRNIKQSFDSITSTVIHNLVPVGVLIFAVLILLQRFVYGD